VQGLRKEVRKQVNTVLFLRLFYPFSITLNMIRVSRKYKTNTKTSIIEKGVIML